MYLYRTEIQEIHHLSIGFTTAFYHSYNSFSKAPLGDTQYLRSLAYFLACRRVKFSSFIRKAITNDEDLDTPAWQ